MPSELSLSPAEAFSKGAIPREIGLHVLIAKYHFGGNPSSAIVSNLLDEFCTQP